MKKLASGFCSWTLVFYLYHCFGVVLLVINQVVTLLPSMPGYTVKLSQEVFPGCLDLVVLIKAHVLFLALGPSLKMHIICKNPFHLLS